MVNFELKPTCIVPQCCADLLKQSSVRYHRVPLNDVGRTIKWLIAVDRKDLSGRLRDKMCVCSLHFAPENFAQGKLKKSAIPDTNLPPTKETTLHNDFIQMSQDVVASEYQHMTEALMAAKWANTCRACLAPIEDDPEDLFDNVNKTLFQQCTSLEPSSHDYLPQNLCGGCHSMCWGWFKFKTTCERSQSLLQSLLRQHMNESTKDYVPKAQTTVSSAVQTIFNYEDLVVNDTGLDCRECNFTFPASEFFQHQCNAEQESKVPLSDLDSIQSDSSEVTDLPTNRDQRTDFKVDDNTGTLMCPDCGMQFKQLAKLKPHLMSHALVKEAKCIKCNQIFTNTVQLEEHCTTEHPQEVIRSYFCQYCDGNFSRYKFLLKHTYKHEGVLAALSHGAKYKCPKCDDIKISETALKNHVKECVPYSYTCAQCNKAFKNPALLRRHKSEHNPNEYLCNTCGKVYKCKSSLKAHALTHMERTAKCEVCHRNFFGIANLNKHMKRVHSAEKHACEFCLMEFKSSKAIRAHMATHMARQFKCDFCQKTFKFQISLDKHKEKCFAGKKVTVKKKTRGEVVYCPVCSLDFAAVPAVRQHLQEVHRDDGIDIDRAFESIKVFGCSQCGKSFATMRNLKDHMATHSTNKPHECEVCKKRFRDTSQLAVHLIKHRNELKTADTLVKQN